MNIKQLFLGLIWMIALTASGQGIIFKGTIYDAVAFIPIQEASIYNVSTKKYVFSNEKGEFSAFVKLNDTLIISHSIYRQLVFILDKENFSRGHNDILLYHKAFMLREVRVIGLNATYEGFKRDVVNVKLPDSYKNLQNVHLTKEERRNAVYTNEPANILKGTKIGSPITFLYNKFNKKMQMRQLYYEMLDKEDEVQMLPKKYNRELVSQLTGLEGADLLEFMVFCRFSYYDLVRWTQEEIIAAIRYKYSEYEYYKVLEEDDDD